MGHRQNGTTRGIHPEVPGGKKYVRLDSDTRLDRLSADAETGLILLSKFDTYTMESRGLTQWFLMVLMMASTLLTLMLAEAAPRKNRHRVRHERIRDTPVIETSLGPIRGLSKTVHGKIVHMFLGVPFAKPPVGELRFRKPLPAEPWTDVFDANSLPNSCIQESYEYYPDNLISATFLQALMGSTLGSFYGEEMWNPNTNVSEDCLYLNLWVPDAVLVSATSSSSGAASPANGSAVLAWIYGGGYMSGTSTLDVYDGDILAVTEKVIVVSMNYRVGALGFLCLGIEQFPCNQGLWDQALALTWIQKNVARFGGNPDLVTVFGESAGGGSVSSLFLSPLTRHLAKRGIMQSGSLNAPWSYMTKATAKLRSLAVVDLVECDSSQFLTDFQSMYTCLMEMPSKNFSVMQWYVYEVGMRFPFSPTIDGVLLPKSPAEMLRDRDFKKTELLLGSNLDEGSYFVLYDFFSSFNKEEATLLTRSQYEVIMRKIFKDLDPLEISAVLFQYTDWHEPENSRSNQQMISAAVGDSLLVCPTNFFAQSFAAAGNDVYYYYFTWRTAAHPWGSWMGVLHGDEIDYVFGHPLNKSKVFTREEKELSKRVMKHYANFARTGDPSLDSGPAWPKYTRENPVYLEWNANRTGEIGKGPRARECAFWNEFMPHLRVAHDPEGQPRCGLQTEIRSSDKSAQLTARSSTFQTPAASLIVASVCFASLLRAKKIVVQV
ncbi:unnamed protein product [Notodromas monacha]|uniref:acetylcholinesterase n=1 Tax=Notodromas monacha TaxID=399045 RepID=A0A7R9G9Q2_9CRUS|nr:unnamed protein product [Notodromas monacha]CAG0913163.1 unnamed protein product [Notodromas monacha]